MSKTICQSWASNNIFCKMQHLDIYHCICTVDIMTLRFLFIDTWSFYLLIEAFDSLIDDSLLILYIILPKSRRRSFIFVYWHYLLLYCELTDVLIESTLIILFIIYSHSWRSMQHFDLLYLYEYILCKIQWTNILLYVTVKKFPRYRFW